MSHVPIEPVHPVEPPLPRAGIDPIDSEAIARRLLRGLAAWPPRHETIAILLRPDRCGVAILTVDGTTCPDAVFDVAATVLSTWADDPSIRAVILASIRPVPPDPDPGRLVHLDDLDRWIELDEQFRLTPLELVDWFVVDSGVTCPRELVGDPPRWQR